MQRLRDNGVFRGFHADVDPAAVGIGLQALVIVRLRRHAEDLVMRFWEHTEEMPEVRAVYHLSGGNDFLCHVVVRDSDHLRRVAVSGFTSLPEVAGEGAYLVDARHIDAITRGMNRLMNDRLLRHQLTTLGTRRLIDFTWRACAERFAETVEDCMGIQTTRMLAA